MTADACAAIVARDDPHLHATAMVAPPPLRARLMVLYAFDIELSRAAQSSTESLIPRMRLQWWRDTVESARAGLPPPAHDVGGPLARLVGDAGLPADLLDALIDAREMELDGQFDAAGFATWTDRRFGALTALAAHLLSGGAVDTVTLGRCAGPVLGTAFALRHLARMADENRFLLPGLAPADRHALSHGDLTDAAASQIRDTATAALAMLADLRARRRPADRRAAPAFLPLLRAERVLVRARGLSASPEGSAAPLAALDDAQRPFEGLGLALRAATGLW